MGFFKRLFGGDSQATTLEDAREIQDANAHLAANATGASAKINEAARLLTGRKFRDAIVAYERIAEEHPEQRALCESQIGAARFFLGEYRLAIAHYRTAQELGADAEMMADNIEEAEAALRKHGA